MRTLIKCPINSQKTKFTYVEIVDGYNCCLTEPEAFNLVDVGSAEIVDYDLSALDVIKKIDGERSWRDSELRKVDVEIRDAEDLAGNFNALEWRAYAILLRNWPSHPDFPDSTKRPIK